LLDIDEFLPLETYQWCQNQLQHLGFNAAQQASTDDNPTPSHAYYLQLRTLIDEHLRSNQEPQLALSEKPTGAFDWCPHEPVREEIEEAELANEGPDMEEN